MGSAGEVLELQSHILWKECRVLGMLEEGRLRNITFKHPTPQDLQIYPDFSRHAPSSSAVMETTA